MEEQKYVPGVCNIGPSEIYARKRIGWIGLIALIIIDALLTASPLNHYWRLAVFFPAVMAATGFIQGYSHFCAGFGMKGFFNFGSEVGKTESVQQQEFRAKDKRRAWQIVIASILIGIVAALLATYL